MADSEIVASAFLGEVPRQVWGRWMWRRRLHTDDLPNQIKDLTDGVGAPFKTLRKFTVGTEDSIFEFYSLIFGESYRDVTLPAKEVFRFSSERAKGVMCQSPKVFAVAEEEQEIEVVAPTMYKLGLFYSATTNTIIERGRELGLERVSVEDVMRVGFNYRDQPNREVCVGTHEPISISSPEGGEKKLTTKLGRHDREGIWLETDLADPDRLWRPHHKLRFLFRRG